MTKKIKIPQEVADAIEGLRKVHSKYGVMAAVVKRKSEIGGWSNSIKTIRDWTFEMHGNNADNLLEVLVNGYEVEQPPLKIGDWVQDNQGNIGVVSRVEGTKIWGEWNGNKHQAYALSREIVKKFTPEEIEAEEERQKWAEIETGDVLKGIHSGTYAVFIKHIPEDKQVDVLIRNKTFESWDADSCELYAKKVNVND